MSILLLAYAELLGNSSELGAFFIAYSRNGITRQLGGKYLDLKGQQKDGSQEKVAHVIPLCPIAGRPYSLRNFVLRFYRLLLCLVPSSSLRSEGTTEAVTFKIEPASVGELTMIECLIDGIMSRIVAATS